MPASGRNHQHTIAEYLGFEESAVDRHEFHDGEITMMQPSSYWHSVINANLLGYLVGALASTDYPCSVAT